ncbi:MAG: intradiol ring-cleavage dioxygenase [Chitinophagaceae bacterium]|nr:intradiol ring-cleavage dioxygenase [Chitinophagaceae bacterium]
MKLLLPLAVILLFASISCAQTNDANRNKGTIGGPCEGCEAIYESPTPFEKLDWFVKLPDWGGKGIKLGINGIVYKADGKTPAANVIIYVYHTNQQGIYPTKGDEKDWAKRHGYIRGWMKTNEKGEYKFMTLRPGSYPNSKIPAHIHVFIKEPGKNEYWIDEFVFNDDPFLTTAERANHKGRGGVGVLKTIEVEKDFQKATRDIILGKEIPGYR